MTSPKLHRKSYFNWTKTFLFAIQNLILIIDDTV